MKTGCRDLLGTGLRIRDSISKTSKERQDHWQLQIVVSSKKYPAERESFIDIDKIKDV